MSSVWNAGSLQKRSFELDALFYPTLSLRGPARTNPNLLFFEQIRAIAPEGEARKFFDGPTRLLMECELVRPIHTMRHACDDEDDERVIGHLLVLAQQLLKSQGSASVHLGKIAFWSYHSMVQGINEAQCQIFPVAGRIQFTLFNICASIV